MSQALPVLTGAATIGPGFAARPARAPEGAGRSAQDTPIPHVIAWNLTQRCNLACAHCYISAGSWHAASGELTTDECRRITDEILELSPAPMFILSGGEPLLREDLEEIARHATGGGATVVVGTNGTRLSTDRIRALQDAGVTGVAISVDSLDARYHDRFRHGTGALSDTLLAVDRLREERLDFVVQTTVTRGNRHEIAVLADWAATAGAVSFNVYFLVATGRGEGMHGLTPTENEDVLSELIELERTHRGRMMVRSKCQPQIMRHAHQAGPDSPLLQYGTRCPCGVHYARITPEGKLTPCPYTPVVAGDLRRQSFAEVWRTSAVLEQIRGGVVGGKCGVCEYRAICGGCRARAYAETGDLMAADTSCAYEPAGDAPLVRPPAVAYGGPVTPAQLPWTAEARSRIERVPGFVRNVVIERVERFARERGYDAVTPDVMDEVRRAMPVDFSRRLPFFLRDRAASGPE